MAPGSYYVQAPPPAGYPTRDAPNPASAHHGPVETKSKGDGFWKGCWVGYAMSSVDDVGQRVTKHVENKYYSKMSSSTNSGAAYPPPPCSTAPSQAPPPAGYPTRDAPNPHGHGAVETKSKGDGFWKGCCAALCCCCVLDACF
ncbi:uncharacterized protein LOC117630399 [Prunus dulcis]|uniref:uncharacterized protein LOC117630399 n=1 Tax=Prunus dulcis TaxID=3755 RepID=UPI001483475F|nr:uncharacterized protein LOC117630399 [Prunus dulcis]